MRREIFFISLLSLIITISAIHPLLAEEEIKFAITSAVGSDPDFTNYRELSRYVADKMQKKAILITGLNYTQVDNLFLKGQVDVGFLCNCHYVRRGKEVGFELLAASIVTDYEKAKFQIYIIVHKDSNIASLDELKGKTVDFADPPSTTTVYGAYMLAQKNEALASYFKKAMYSGSHDMTIELVANKVVDGGFIDGHIWDYHQKVRPVYSEQTKVIHKSPDFTIPPVVVPKTLNEATKKKIKEILLAMHEDPEGIAILKKLRIDKFVDIKDEDYQNLYQMYDEVKPHLQKEE